MKPSRLFVSQDDFSNRFKDTFIYYNGIPKYVHSCTQTKASDPGTYAFNCFDFNDELDFSKKVQLVYLDDEGVNFRHYNLGYSQYNEFGCMWVARMPARQWKQGLRKDQCQFVGYQHDDEAVHLLTPTKYTYRMMMNEYIDPKNAIEFMKAHVRRGVKLPIHKNFALYAERNSTDLAPEYKGIMITQLSEGGGLQVKPEFRYLLQIPEYHKLLNELSIR